MARCVPQEGGLRGHALGIYSILLSEASKHREAAVAYANEKLPGIKVREAAMKLLKEGAWRGAAARGEGRRARASA
jgi:hypothetical protein